MKSRIMILDFIETLVQLSSKGLNYDFTRTKWKLELI